MAVCLPYILSCSISYYIFILFWCNPFAWLFAFWYTLKHSNIVRQEEIRMSVIKPINSRSIHQICSGQVILDLATAVKELLENAIDAGATSIEIRLKDYGKSLIEVADNGQGVEESNYEGLTRKYCTSKLQDFSDLTSVATFGFRGEALSSLSALSVMTITTRFKSAKVGHKLEYDHYGKITKKSSIARQPGTTVTLKDIFCSLPVRHKEFEKNLKREYSKLLTLLYSYCVVCTDIQLSCSNELKGTKQDVFRIVGANSAQVNIIALFGSKVFKSLIPFKQIPPTEEVCENYNISHCECQKFSTDCNISGYISSCGPGLGRRSTDMQFMSINKRPCSLPKIIKLLNEIFHMFNKNQFPFLQVDISVRRDQVDVNVTPDKRQVFLTHEKYILAILKSSLLDMYNGMNHAIGSIKSQPSIKDSLNCFKSVKDADSPENKGDAVKRTESFLKKLQQYDAENSKSSSYLGSTREKFDSVIDGVGDNAPLAGNIVARNGNVGHSQHEDTILSPMQGSDSLIMNGNIGLTESTEYSQESQESNNVVSPMLPSDMTLNENTATRDQKKSNIPLFNLTKLSSFCHSSSGWNSHFSKEKFSRSLDSSDSSRDEFPTNVDSSSFVKPINRASSPISIFKEMSPKLGDCAEAPYRTDAHESIDKAQHELRYSFKSVKKNWNMKQRMRQEIHKKSVINESGMFKAKISSSENSQAEEELSKHFSRNSFKEMDVIGQFNLGFIIARHGNDLFIIDQHASDEKYNFETLQRNTKLRGQPLIVPQKLDLTASDMIVLEDNMNIFNQNGFSFKIQEDSRGQNSVFLVKVPSSQNWVFDSSDVSELLFVLRDSPHVLFRPSRIRQMFASRACRKSVMIGTPLTFDGMRRVIDHMSEMDQPWNCPHGRPTMRHLIDMSMIFSSKSR